MLKRTLAMLLALVLVISMMPLGVVAESTAQKNTTYTAPLAQHNHAASGDAHICEHCVAAGKTGADAVPTWTAFTGSTLPTTSGHYYLTGDVTVGAATLTNADVVLCLNGYTVNAKSANRFYTMKQGGKLTVLDCTAKTVTPENEEDTGYRAGKLALSTDYAFMFANEAGNDAQLFWYDGILAGGRKAATGGLMSIQRNCDVYFYGGEVRDCNTGTGTAGGPIYLAGSGNTFHAEDTAFIGLSSATAGGVFTGGAATVELTNCLFKDNAAATVGGVFNSNTGMKITAVNCTFTGNTAKSNGGVFSGKGGYFKATGCTITGSTAADHAAVCGSGSQVQILLDSCIITGNTATNASGAVFVPNSGCPLTLKGSTVIYGNTRKGGVPGNIHLQSDNNGNHPVVTVEGLTAGAKIGINVNSTRLAASKVLSKALNSQLTRAQVIEYFYADDSAYMIDLVEDKLTLAQGHVHTAHLPSCSVAGCTGHENALYLPWTGEKSLPTSGSYYLDTDVALDADVTMSTGTLNLCLNGHTVTFGNHRFVLTGDANVSITDCSAKTENDVYTAGKLTGATNCMFQVNGDSSGKKTVVNVYEGIITGNSRPKDHAAVVFIEKNSSFNLYGGEITENTVGAGSTGRGGVIYLQDNTVTFNMYGGKIYKNQAVKNGTYGGNGGAVYSRDRGIVNILGGEITGNTAETDGGAIWAKGGSVTVKNAKITGNEAKGASGAIYGAGSSVQITLDGAEVTGNKSAKLGAIYIPNNGAKIIVQGDTKITGNTGGNVYLAKDSNTTSPNHPMITLGAAGLGANARIGITMPSARLTAEPHASLTLGGKLTEDQVAQSFFCDNTDYEVVLKNDRLLVQQAGSGHKHCVCGVTGCTEHAQLLCKPWSDTEKLPTSGSYYLEVDVTTKTQPVLTTGTLNLCLNGHTITIKERFAISGDATLNITDCTAKTEQGAYTAGRITGAGGTVFYMTGDNTGKHSAVNFYQGVLMGNHRTAYGAASVAYIQSGASFNLYGGEIYGNTLKPNNSTEDKGGIIYINNKTGTFNMYGGTITGNTVFRNQNDTTKGGHGIIFNNGGSVNLLGGKITDNVVEGCGGAVYTSGGTVKLENMTISGNKAATGGAIYAKSGATVTDKNSVIENNTASGSGAIYCNGGSVTLVGTKITGNQANTMSAINGGGGVQITLDGAVITGNKAQATGTTYGAIYTPNNNSKVILQGATKIENNEGGDLYLVKDSNTKAPNHPMITLGDAGLAAGAHIGITMPNARLNAEPYASLVLNGALTAQQVAEYFFTDVPKYGVSLKDDRLFIGRAYQDIGHKHCLCSADITGCDHTQLQWLAWDDPTSLPASGNFVLTVDVKTSQNVAITETLNLCLNGHTIEAAGSQEGTYADRIFDMKGQGVLNLTDCQGTGKLTGGTYGVILFESNGASTPVLNLYGGNLTGNKSVNYGGAVLVQGGGTFNMYGGKIFGNTMTGYALVDAQGSPELDADGNQKTSGTNGGGGAVALYGGKTTFNMYGGEISGNESLAVTYLNAEGKQAQVGGRGGAVYVTGGTVNIYGGKIADNKGSQGGAIYAINKSKLNILGGEICGNEALSGGGAVFADAAAITVENASLCDNVSATQGGAVYMTGGSLAVKNGKLTGNTATAMSAIRAGGGAKLTLDGAVITGNTATSDSFPYGAVYVPNGNCSITLKGAVTVSGNAGGNLYLTKDSNKDKPNHPLLTVDGLTEGAKVSIAMPTDRMAAEPFASTVLNGQLTEAQVAQYFVCDNDRYAVSLKDDRLHIAKFYLDIGHKHCLCGADLQGCDHKEVNFIAWDDPKSLPTSGNYCLTVDVKTSQNVSILGSDTLNLCLNGHTIEAAGSQEGTWRDRIFDIKEEGTLNITDCTGKGQLTGGTYGAILFENNANSKTTLNLYGGHITGNKSVAYGGAILLQGGGTFNMYGGQIHGNAMTGSAQVDEAGKPVLDEDGNQKTTGTQGGGGAVALHGAKTTFNMYGGEIYDNESLPVTYLKADGKEGTVGGLGGAIYSTRGTINIQGGQVYGNRARQGGGIYAVVYSTINLSDGQIRENVTTHHGGGIFADNCYVTVSGGKITANDSGEKGSGAGIQVSNSRGFLKITGGEITDNKGYYGGGIMCQGRCPITIEGGLIARNSADTAGGVYISTMSPAKMTGGTITENYALNNAGGLYALRTVLDFTGGEVSKNKADREAGGVFLYGATINIDGGKIAGNTSAKHAGGLSTGRLTVKGAKLEDKMEGMNNLVDGDGVQFRATVNLLSGSVESNVSGSAGGGMLLQGYATLNIKGGTVKNNQSGGSGGGAYMSTNCTVNMSGGTVSGNNAKGTGGGFYLNGAKGTFSGGVIEKNVTKKQGGGICASASEVKLSGVIIRNHYHEGTGAGYTGFTSKTTMTGGSITGNYGKNNGGGMYLQRGSLVISGGSISYNSTKGSGAAIHALGVKTYIYGGYFAGNKCEGTGGGVLVTGRYGYKENGVQKQDLPYVEIHGGTFTENYARNGGAFLIQAGATLKVTGGTFTKNEAPSAGGAMYVSNNIKFEITGGTFTDNKTNGDGGAINFQGPQGIMDGSDGKILIENNYAKNYGGGFNITGQNADVTVKNLKVQNCFAGNRGGGASVNTKAHANLEGVEICNNHADVQGGGFYVGHAPVVSLKNVHIHDNDSLAAGAGIATECDNEFYLEDCVIENNETVTKAGGIYVRSRIMHLKNCKILNNVAGGDGGGLATGYQFGRGGEIGSGNQQTGVIIENCEISGNTCVGAGGGVHNNTCNHIILLNSKITGNTSGTEGSGVWAREDVKMVDTTITGNKSKTDGYAVYLEEASYDGQSYIQAVYAIGGDMIVKDNEGGDVYMGAVNAIGVTAEGLTEGTDFYITLDSGLLTRRLFGVYNYQELGDFYYHVTAGDRSLTDPQVAAAAQEESTEPTETQAAQQPQGEDNTGLYIGIGAIAGVVVLAAAILVILKKKKAGKSTGATKE